MQYIDQMVSCLQLQQENHHEFQSIDYKKATDGLLSGGDGMEHMAPADFNKFESSFMQKYVFCIVCAVVAVFVLAYQNRHMVPSPNHVSISGNQHLYLHVANQKNQKIRLSYLSPNVITPSKIPENALEQLPISDEGKEINKFAKLQSLTLKSKLYLNWFNQDAELFEAQYIYYNKKYDMETHVKEKQICVVSPYRNLISSVDKSYRVYLRSINEQNYSNYHVYMIDDLSQDDSVHQILSQVQRSFPRLNNRISIIKNKENIGALGNRDFTTRNFCNPGSIVIDIDGDDALIGRQVFNFINRFYHFHPHAWFAYTNHLLVTGTPDGQGRDIDLQTKMQPGICDQIDQIVFQSNTYRTNKAWVTSQLRTYLRDLYIKIPLSHVIEPGTIKYYIRASDRFSMYGLVELAGERHTYYIQQYTYFYYAPNFVVIQSKGCNLGLIFYNELLARILTPLKTLQSLEDEVETIKDYKIPNWIQTLYKKRKQEYERCLQKHNK